MRTTVLALLSILATYLVAWLSMYSWVMHGDLSHLAEYFRLGWQGGGELPTLIQLYALAMTATVSLLSAIAFLVVRARGRR